jgi:preprotein translocase SecE subunit
MAVVYKPGQGYWTRTMTAVAAGVLAVSTGAWVWAKLGVFEWTFDPIYAQAVGAAVVILIIGAVVYWLVGRKRNSAEFLIATDAEMKKVNWSTRREIVGHTWVVVGVSFIIAIILFATDLFFASISRAAGIIET